MITVRYVNDVDKDFWYSLDQHLPEQEFDKKVRDHQGYVLFDDEIPKALLRYNLFWDNTPFCTMLFVEWSEQKKGYGRKLMEYWEKDMKEQGYGMVMTSTQVDEERQSFGYRRGLLPVGNLQAKESCEGKSI